MKVNLNTYKNYLLFAVFFIVLFLSYTINFWKVSDDNQFKYHDVPNESLAIGRLVHSDRNGIFSESGFPGRHINVVQTKGGRDSVPDPGWQNLIQYHYYYEKDSPIPEHYEAYKSQTGGQLMIYGFLQKILPVSPQHKLIIFRAINAFFFILCILLFLSWCIRNFNYTASIITFLLIAISSWLNNFSHSLWWAFAAFYIPFVCTLLYCEQQDKYPQKFTDRKLFLVIYIAIFIKGILNGFEFVTTTIIAALCPLIYYHFVINKKKIIELIKTLLKASLAISLAILSNLLILLIQLKSYFGSYMEGIEYIIYSLTKRTKFNVPGTISIPEDAGFLNVLKIYVNGNAFALDFLKLSFDFKFYYFFLVLIICSIIILFLNKNLNRIQKLKNNALLITTYLSIVAPLSWYIIFKQHAYTHPGLDYIVWYIPFLLFVFLVMGQMIYLTAKLLHNKMKRKYNAG